MFPVFPTEKYVVNRVIIYIHFLCSDLSIGGHQIVYIFIKSVLFEPWRPGDNIISD